MSGDWPNLIVPEVPSPYRHRNDRSGRKIEWDFLQLLLDEYALGQTWSDGWAAWVLGTSPRTILRWRKAGFVPQNAVEDLLERRERGETYRMHGHMDDDLHRRCVVAGQIRILTARRDEKGRFYQP